MFLRSRIPSQCCSRGGSHSWLTALNSEQELVEAVMSLSQQGLGLYCFSARVNCIHFTLRVPQGSWSVPCNYVPTLACRNSKLTMLLQDSLGGDAKALMFCNLASSATHATETLSSLGFASKVSNVVLRTPQRKFQDTKDSTLACRSAPKR